MKINLRCLVIFLACAIFVHMAISHLHFHFFSIISSRCIYSCCFKYFFRLKQFPVILQTSNDCKKVFNVAGIVRPV